MPNDWPYLGTQISQLIFKITEHPVLQSTSAEVMSAQYFLKLSPETKTLKPGCLQLDI